MSFIPQSGPGYIEGVGRENAKIFILGDCPDGHSIKARRPFAGPQETVLEGCLHQASLTKSEVYITNFIPDGHKVEKYWNPRSKKVIANIDDYRMLLTSELEKVKPDIIVTLGELPAFILTGNGYVSKTRGYPFKREGRIVIPAQHPGMMIWGNYIWRFYLSHDLNKARELAERPELLHAPEIEIRIPDTFDEALSMLAYVATFKKLSVDIEVANFEVSCIGFATCADYAISIPIDMRWTLEEEVTLWIRMARILEDRNITKIGQNFIFDIHFLALKMGIITRGPIIDTMMAHSIMYPDFLKGLNFLGSVYTKQPYWKDMVKFKDIKKES